ncbi:MAG TPA: hypothetical protein VFD00_07895 [Thermoclostridium sp.]|nr:hypothetical protein [Thermoclostridium sp.]
MSYRKWTKISIDFFLIVTIIVILQTSNAFANDAVLGMTPEGVYPITQSDIVMISEEIHIQLLDRTNAKVTCRFDFQNFGDAQTVLMGFPAELNEFGEITPPEAFWAHHFTARDENGDLEVSLVDTIPNPPLKEINQMEKYNKWYSFSVNFASNEVKTLHHTYDISIPYNSMGDVYVGYVLETGALWKGSLGHSKVIFDFGDIPIYTLEEAYPNNFYTIDGNQLIWERSDFKPSHNLLLTINPYRYSEDYFNMYKEASPEHLKPFREKIEFFKLSSDTIQKNSEHYYQLYQTLVNEDPICALYIKSALGLPNGNRKPEFVECSTRHQIGNTWYFDISAIDPDGDLVSCNAVIDGIDSFEYSDSAFRGQVLRFDPEKKQFLGQSYLMTEEKDPFSITFILTDTYGNMDTKTIMLQADAPEPSPTKTSTASPGAEPEKEQQIEDQKSLSVSQTVQDIETDIDHKTNVLHMEEETVPLLKIGVTIVLLCCFGAVIYLYLKSRKNGYILFFLQLIFLSLAFIRALDILTMKIGNTTMLSENVSLSIGLSALYWAISMGCMMIGILMIGKKGEG